MKECISLLAREFLLKGEIQTPCCCLFIGFNDGTWLKAFYNDETYTWELVKSNEVPDPNRPLGDSEFNYPYKQYLPSGLNSCGSLIENEIQGNTRLVITFSSNLEVVLSYDSSAEKESIEINT